MAKAKMIVVALAAIGAMALGASSALAATGDTVACKTASAPCPTSSQYPANTSFTAALKAGTGGAVLKTNIDTVTCTASTASVSNTAQSGTPLPGQINSLTFTSCSDSNSQSCAVTVNGLPYGGSILAGSTAGNGTLKLNTANVKVVCGSFINCTFSAPSGGISAAFTGGNPADIKFTNAAVSNTGGILCPSTATYSADYSTNGTNQAVWVEKSA